MRAAASFDTDLVVAPAEEARLLELLRDALGSLGVSDSAARLVSAEGVPLELAGFGPRRARPRRAGAGGGQRRHRVAGPRRCRSTPS